MQNGDFTMSTSKEYMQFVLDQLEEFPDVTYRKMFGEYMVYLQGRPVLLVCDNCAMVKKLPELAELMRGAPDGLPYEGARVHSVLDLEDRELVRQVMDILLRVTPLPKRRIQQSKENAIPLQRIFRKSAAGGS